jgi:hypothetical protein
MRCAVPAIIHDWSEIRLGPVRNLAMAAKLIKV